MRSSAIRLGVTRPRSTLRADVPSTITLSQRFAACLGSHMPGKPTRLLEPHLQSAKIHLGLTFIGEIQGEKYGTAGRCNGIESGANIVDPIPPSPKRRKSRETDEEEGQGVKVKWSGETVNRLESTEDEPPDDRCNQINRCKNIQLICALCR